MSITLEAIPATMGWSIVAKAEGQAFLVEAGLETPEGRLQYWNQRKNILRKAIDKALSPPRQNP